MVNWSRKNKVDDSDDGDAETCMIDTSLNLASQLKQQHSLFVKKLQLNTINDIQAIQNEISEGNMAIIDVAGFITSGEFTVLELKRAIEQLRGTCKKLGGALARLGDRYLVATPNDRMQLMV
nr:cell division protein SepF [Candidatus Sigynarchaeota archaeon]